MAKEVKDLTKLKENFKYEVPASLLAFTFFFSVFIYILLLGFCFLQWRMDMKSKEK